MSKTDEERFEAWTALDETEEEARFAAGRVAASPDCDPDNVLDLAMGFLAGLESERARTRELVARIKALPVNLCLDDVERISRDDALALLEVFDA